MNMCSGGSNRRHSSTVAAVCVSLENSARGIDAALHNRLDAVAGGMDGSLMAGIEQQNGGGNDLLLAQALPVLVCRDHQAEQVLARRPAALGDHLLQIVHEVDRRTVGVVLARLVDAEHVHRHHPVRPVEQLRRHLRRQADHFGDDDGGDRRRIGINQVDRAVGGEAVDELVRQGSNTRPQLLDVTRNESSVDEGSATACGPAAPAPAAKISPSGQSRRRAAGASASPVSSRVATCRICRPKRLSRSSALTSRNPAKHQWA